MNLPVINGIIDRRVLINFRIDPNILAKILPQPFQPILVNDFAIGGICLIRLKKIKPKFMPIPIGVSSENAAHRFAVKWIENGVTKEGVYIPRRDTNSWLNAFAGGKLFPGIHHYSNFSVSESPSSYSISMRAKDKSTTVSVIGAPSVSFEENSIFKNLEEVSSFFESGSLGYSDTNNTNEFDGIELKCKDWQTTPFKVSSVDSSYFNDESKFPKGSITFDNAILMKNIAHEWHSRKSLCC